MNGTVEPEEDGDILIATAGPLAAHHLLLHLSGEHRVTLHGDAAGVDNGALAAAALEIWQTAASAGGGRWRWYLLPRGHVVEEAPGDVHRLRPWEAVALTVTRSALPDRDAVGRFRQALRGAGASCVLCRSSAVPVGRPAQPQPA